MDRNHVLNLKDPPNGFRDQVINAGIIAGFNFFSTLAGLGATQAVKDPTTCFLAAAISAGVSFFASLVTQRGLKKES